MCARKIKAIVLCAVLLTLCVLASAGRAADKAPIRPINGWYSIPRIDLPNTLDIRRVENGWRVTDSISGAVLEVRESDIRFSSI